MKEISQTKTASSSSMGMIAFIVIVLALIGSGVYIIGQQNPPKDQAPSNQVNQPQQDTSKMSASLADNTIVYGAWTQSSSVIKAIDLSNGAYHTLATLPTDIKKVSVASPDSLIYINQTDNRDHGKQVAVYSLINKSITSTIPASDGFGIDDYVVSPNRKYLATWEVAFADGSGILNGGKSRVYTIDLTNPSIKNLVYDEIAIDTLVHYPLAILNDGRVFLDMFRPNDPSGGAGWSYGISVSSFDGVQKQDLAQMGNGTYGTQPLLSPDGAKFAFAGYDGTQGPGDVIKNGFRQALLTPNTVEILDANTLVRQKLSNLPNTNTYSTVNWDLNGNLLLDILTKDIDSNGLHNYNLISNTLAKMNVNSVNTAITSLSEDKLLVGITDNSVSVLGNLGAGYEAPFSQFIVQDFNNSQVNMIPLTDPLMQYIGLVNANYFGNTNSAMVAELADGQQFIDLYSNLNAQKDNLQLYTFAIKPSLAPAREAQQSLGGDTSGIAARCQDLRIQQGLQIDSPEWIKQKKMLKASGSCYDSPLYLYGPTGKAVKINVSTYVFDSHPIYENGFKTTLLKDGNMLVNGVVTDSIKYDYIPAIKKINAPLYGTITSIRNLPSILSEYAQKIGLNKKETEDLIEFGIEKVTMPFVFISFFNQDKSEEILPLSFSPKPDNYLNIVFYFKQYSTMPVFIPAEPVFDSALIRSGFTAVEISGIVE